MVLVKDAAGQLRRYIDEAVEPSINPRRLVIRLTARVADVHLAAELTDEMNTAIDDMVLNRNVLAGKPQDAEARARAILDRIEAASRH